MGLLDLFKRKSKNAVPLITDGKPKVATVSKNNNQMKDRIEVKAFPRKGFNDMVEYFIQLNIGDTAIEVGTTAGRDLKRIVKEMEDIIAPFQTDTNKLALDEIGQVVVEELEKIANENHGFRVNAQAIQFFNKYQQAQSFNYKDLTTLPTSLDLSNMSDEEKMEIGKWMQGRLNMLNKIKTPEDAYRDIRNLLSYMQTYENVPSNPVVEANERCFEGGEKLDEETVIKISRNLQVLENEDGALYSVYLRIEEKRVWKQLQERLLEYSQTHDGTDGIYELSDEIKGLEGTTKQEGEDGFSYDVLKYIIGEINELNIENYITNIKEKDFQLATQINKRCPDIPDKTTILQYLYARIASLGQLSCRGSSFLRDFVANTTFKDKDNSETKKFLLLVAQSEKQYIEKNYEALIKQYHERTEKDKSLKEKIKIGYTPSVDPNAIKKGEEGTRPDKQIVE